MRALRGFSIKDTADAWEHRDKSIENYIEKFKFEYFKLEERSHQLQTGIHHFTVAYIQVNTEFDSDRWDKERLYEQVSSWKSNIKSEYGRNLLKAFSDIDLSQQPIGKDIWLALAQWSLQR